MKMLFVKIGPVSLIGHAYNPETSQHIFSNHISPCPPFSSCEKTQWSTNYQASLGPREGTMSRPGSRKEDKTKDFLKHSNVKCVA